MPSDPVRPGRRLRWLAIGLFASVLLNLFLAGVIAGRLTGAGALGEVFGTPSAARFERPVLARFLALPRAERRKFRAAMVARRDTLRPAAAALWQARIHVLAVLAEPNYDAKAVADAFAAVRQATTQAQLAQHEALVQALTTLSPAARAKLGSPLRDDGN